MRAAPLALLVLAAPAPAAAQDEFVTRSYDVRALDLEREEPTERIEVRPPLEAAVHPDDDRPPPLWLEPEVAEWPHVLAQRIAGVEWAELREGLLVVEGPPAVHAEVAELVEALVAQSVREVVLDAFWLAGADLPDTLGGVLASREVDALLAATTPAEHASATAPMARLVLLDSYAEVSAVVGYDVFASEGIVCADPLVAALRDGTEVTAIAGAMAGGALHLRVWARRTELSETRRFVVEALQDVELELPRSRSFVAHGSARIEDGGALVLGDAGSETGVLLVRARRTGQPDRRERPFVPAGDLTASPLVQRPIVLRMDTTRYDRFEWGGHPSRASQEPDSPFRSLDLWRDLERELLERDPASAIAPLADELWIRGAPELRALVAERVAACGARLGATYAVELRHGVVDAATGLRVATGELDAQELATRLEGRTLGACRLGDELQVFSGRESAYVADYWVDVSSGARATEPVVEVLLEGTSLWYQPARGPSGALSAWIDVQHQHAVRELVRQTVVFGTEVGGGSSRGEVELPRVAHHRTVSRLQLEDGVWRLACAAALPGTGRSFVAVIRVSLAPGEGT